MHAALLHARPPSARQMVCNLIAGMRQTTPEEVRAQIMIGDKQECLDTVERYREVGVTHFIFMMFGPYTSTRSRPSPRT